MYYFGADLGHMGHGEADGKMLLTKRSFFAVQAMFMLAGQLEPCTTGNEVVPTTPGTARFCPLPSLNLDKLDTPPSKQSTLLLDHPFKNTLHS